MSCSVIHDQINDEEIEQSLMSTFCIQELMSTFLDRRGGGRGLSGILFEFPLRLFLVRGIPIFLLLEMNIPIIRYANKRLERLNKFIYLFTSGKKTNSLSSRYYNLFVT